jgi:acetyltransferase-like isoleucine patch superfamily enzyme
MIFKNILFLFIALPSKFKIILKTFFFRKITQCGKNVFFGDKSKIHNIQKNRKNINIKDNSFIRGELLTLSYGGHIKIGANSFIGENTKIWSGEEIHIGDNVLIAHNVNVIDFSHESNSIDRSEGFRNLMLKGHPKEKGIIPTKNIRIEDDVIIYANCNIIMGVTIGRGSIISAGSTIIKDIPPFSLVMGNPGIIIAKTS